MHGFQLNFLRQRSAHSVDVDFVRVQPFRFQKNLVLQLVRKLYNLVFNRGAIARSNRLNLPAVHWRAVDVFANNAMRLCRGKRNVARYLRIVMRHALGSKTKWRGIDVAGLRLEFRPVNAAPIQPRRGSSLKTAPTQPEALQRLTEKHRRRLPRSTSRSLLFAAVDQPIQKCSSCNDDGARANPAVVTKHNPANRRVFQNQIRNFRFPNRQIFLGLQNLAHFHPVGLLVTLCSRRPNSRSARRIQQPKLDPNRVRDLAHNAAQGVDFPYQMALGNPANRRITGHLRD